MVLRFGARVLGRGAIGMSEVGIVGSSTDSGGMRVRVKNLDV